jgi:hypothetical protein
MSPAVTKRRIESLSSATSRAICAISPPGSPAPAGRARSAYSAAAWSRVSSIWSCSVWIAPARVPEPRELLVEAVLAGLVERQLGPVERLGACRPLLQVGVLGAVLEVDELVADAAVGLDVDARADVRAGAADDAAGRDLQRVGGDERDLLARVALGRRVGDVVPGGVHQALLGQQAAQRRLESVEGGDRHG